MARRLRWSALATALPFILSACGGGGDPAPERPVVVASADSLNIALGQSGQLLSNDTVGGAAATSTNTSFAVTTGTLPAGVTASNGTVTVASTAVPGTVSFGYTICQSGDSSNCASTTAQITIPAPPIVATADSFNLAAGGSGDVLANDTLGGAAASSATVSASATGTPQTGITLASNGLIAVDSTAAPGDHVLDYRICQTIVPTNCATATATVTVPALGTLTGRAVDAATGLGISGVSVVVGGASTTTNTSGNFSLAAVASAARVTVAFSASAYADSARVASVVAGQTVDVQARLVPVGATVNVDVAAGGAATMAGSPAQVTLPGNGVQRSDGSVPSGSMSVQITPLNAAADSAVMPGDFTAMVAGAASPIESFGAMNVRLSDSAGATLNLRSGQTATVRLPLSSRSANPPTTIPLFYFDNSSGRWVQEGTATLAGSGSSRYYEGTVSHFSTWNADQVYNTVRITGCVVDTNGVRVTGAVVSADGVDYSGTSSASTDSTGAFVLPIRLGSSATVAGYSAGLLTNTLRVGPYAADTTLSGCLTLGQAGAGVTMKLTWGQRPSDLDSHLFAPNGSHVYYSSRGSLTAAPYANLDVDDTSSYGPEVVTLTRLMVGTYKYSVYNYSGYGAGSITVSGARVELNIPGRTVELLTPPAGETSSTNWWNLFEMDVDAVCNITVRRVANFGSSTPVTTSSSPVYCTPS
jgi:uncharacterized protein YfaP (DUF2135 family)